MNGSAIENSASIPQFSILRGLHYTLLFSSIGVAIPWAVFSICLLYKLYTADVYRGFVHDQYLGYKLDLLLVSVWLSSIIGATSLASYSFKPCLNFRRKFCVIAGLAILSRVVYTDSIRTYAKSQPLFGETWTDLLVLSVPAYLMGLILVIYQILRRNNHAST